MSKSRLIRIAGEIRWLKASSNGTLASVPLGEAFSHRISANILHDELLAANAAEVGGLEQLNSVCNRTLRASEDRCKVMRRHYNLLLK